MQARTPMMSDCITAPAGGAPLVLHRTGTLWSFRMRAAPLRAVLTATVDGSGMGTSAGSHRALARGGLEIIRPLGYRW